MENSRNTPLPQEKELEEAVIGALLVESRAISLVIDCLRPEMFYDPKLETIYASIEAMFHEGKKVDILTVKEELQKQGKLQEIGGAYNITWLSSKVASSAHLETHAMILKDKYLKRELITGLHKALSKAADETFDTEEVLSDIHALIDGIENDCGWKQQLRPMSSLMADTLREAEQRQQNNRNGLTGIPTGLADLDKLTSGLQNNDLILIGARPSVGKTAFGLNMAKAAAQAGHNAVFYSIEMQGERLGDRWILSECRLNATQWRSGLISEEEMIQARATANKLSRLPLYIDDSARMSMDYIRASARMLHSKGKCDVIFIDYLQLSEMKHEKENRNREQEVAQAARKAKMLAKELSIPVVLLSQLNRESETRPFKKPALADLRESGSIEQDADIVILLYRPAQAGLSTDKDSGFPTDHLGVAIVAKHRNGETKSVYFGHSSDMTVISDYTPPMEWVLRQK